VVHWLSPKAVWATERAVCFNIAFNPGPGSELSALALALLFPSLPSWPGCIAWVHQRSILPLPPPPLPMLVLVLVLQHRAP
jgi:hypothetical protein